MVKHFRISLPINRNSLFLLIFFGILSSSHLLCQPPLFRTFDYIETYADEAKHQMATYKIPASVILAQAILESRSGSSELAKRSNNHFGIKCHTTWLGDTIVKDDDTTNECFRRYESIKASYTDHSLFLSNRARYASLFTLPLNDFEGWCYGLKNAGYATSPTYAEELIKLILEKKLYKLDAVEKLTPKFTAERPKTEIKQQRNSKSKKSLADFVNAQILFADERDILIQSLRLNAAKALSRAGDLAKK